MRIIEKLRSKRGETLVELLVSMAILSLSICFMVTMIMLSANFDKQARAADEKYREELDFAENCDDLSKATTVNVKLEKVGGGGVPVSIPVKVYAKDSNSELKAYRYP